MKKCTLVVALLLLFSGAMVAQVGITPDNSAPDASAMLDVKSASKGMLIPRMSAVERDAIVNPATGLLIFCTDNKHYYTNKGTPSSKNWVMVSSQWSTLNYNLFYNDGNVGIGETAPSHPLTIRTSHGAGNALRLIGPNEAPGYGARLNFGDGDFAYLREDLDDRLEIHADVGVRVTGMNMGIGTLTPNSSAELDIASTSKGLLIPRMTNAQIATFGSTLGLDDKGMIVFNTDDIKLEYWDGAAWKTMVTKTTTSGGSSDGTSFCSEGVTDYDGHQYNTVKIGDQCWMAENLKSTHYADGSAITENWAYDNDEGLAHTYGRLYTWAAVMHGAASSNSIPSGVQGFCPNGWHVPSDAEWKELEMTLGMTTAQADGDGWRGTHGEGWKMKETDEAFLWNVQRGTGGTNTSGFTALPGGSRDVNGNFNDMINDTFFWSSTESSSSNACYRMLWYNAGYVGRGNWSKLSGYSGRCLKN